MYEVTSEDFLSEKFLSKFDNLQPKHKGILFEVIHLGRYSQWREDLKRREVWQETVQRVVNHSLSLYQGSATREDLIEEAEFLYTKIFNLEILPAGRSLWVGGTKASKQTPSCLYNCAFLAIDELECFCEAFFLLLCGCGVGFSVERQFSSKLPKLHINKDLKILPYMPVPKEDRLEHSLVHFADSKMCIFVGDSKEGWVEALRAFLSAFTVPSIDTIEINVDSVRPAKERIKTFGGFAPGPSGLEKMFHKLNALFNKCEGTLGSVEVVDVMNLIAQNVLVGGNRRAAEIAIGDADDIRFIECKYQENWEPQRIMSNNTVVFDTKPTKEQLRELFERILHNGEPGFFNREAASKRRPNALGLNPCVTGDTWISTSEGPRQVRDLVDTPYKACVEGKEKKATGFWSNGIKPVYLLETADGYTVKLTKDHKILTSNRGWVEAGQLNIEDSIVINTENRDWEGIRHNVRITPSVTPEEVWERCTSSRGAREELTKISCTISEDNLVTIPLDSKRSAQQVQRMLLRQGASSSIVGNTSVEIHKIPRKTSIFKALSYIGEEEVFDCTVEDIHCFDANGIVAHNCSEILLNSRGFCNLSTVNLVAHVDSEGVNWSKLYDSIRLVTRLGMRMTNVTVDLPKWDANQKSDRLTGVSMTGVLDALDLLGWSATDKEAENMFMRMNEAANEEADNYSFEMRIPRPLLVTAIKPEGTGSQLPTVSNGIHRAYAPYYLRRIRMSDIDPICIALNLLGMESIVDPQKEGRLIYEFPIKTNSETNSEDEPARDQYARYLSMQRCYTDHNTSCTLSISREEVPEIVDMVYDNWEDTIACAWLPKMVADKNVYPYLPYEAISKEEYEDRVKYLPDLSELYNVLRKVEDHEYADGLDSEMDSCGAGGACPVR